MLKSAYYAQNYASIIYQGLVTAATCMYDAQLDEATVMNRTKYRSVDGVRAYKRTSEKLRELSSAVLNTPKKQKFEPIPEFAEKKSDMAGSENIAPEFCKNNLNSLYSFLAVLLGNLHNQPELWTAEQFKPLLLCTFDLAWFHIMKYH